MTRLRTILIVVLVLVPVLIIAGAATWALWETGRLFWIWWLLPACWGLAYLLARSARPKPAGDEAADSFLPAYWTARDRRAFQVVLDRQAAVADIPPERLTDPQFYLDTALDIAREMARHYHPKSRNPLSSLTLVEILAATELATEDLQDWVRNYVPGSHLLSVEHWRKLSYAPDWIKTAGDVTWAVSILLDPTNLARYIASRATVTPLTDQIQANVLAAFYIAFIRRAGQYVIEMNSGRLRGGTARYRMLMRRFAEQHARSAAGGSDSTTPAVTLAVVGQTKAGKSSLINCLLGQQQAATDVLPKTRDVQRYRLTLPDRTDQLVLLDTAGYGEDGAKRAQLEDVQEAYQQADLVLLVMDVKSPARDADVRLMREVAAWVDSQPAVKRAPTIGVLTHIDLLSPTMEWSPPYDWRRPTRTKEQSIREAVDYNLSLFGGLLDGVVPVCSDAARERIYGVEEWLVPVMTALLGEARAVSLVRMLHAQWDSGKVRTLMGQLRNAGSALLEVIVTGDGTPAND